MRSEIPVEDGAHHREGVAHRMQQVHPLGRAERVRAGQAADRRARRDRAGPDDEFVNALGGNRRFAGSLGTQVVKVFDVVAARTGLRDTTTGALLGAQLVGRRGAEIAKRVDTSATALFHRMGVRAARRWLRQGAGMGDDGPATTPRYLDPSARPGAGAVPGARVRRGGTPDDGDTGRGAVGSRAGPGARGRSGGRGPGAGRDAALPGLSAPPPGAGMSRRPRGVGRGPGQGAWRA